MPKVKCEQCGKIFQKNVQKNTNSKKTFCNRVCYDLFRNTNTYNIKEDYTELIIYSKTHGQQTILIDTEDYEKVKEYNWGLCHFYMTAYKNKKVIRLHRFLINAVDGLIVDHINRNTLDNRKSNLRMVTPQINTRNCKVYKNRAYEVNGINIRKNKYYVNITINGKTKHLGVYEKLEDAVKCRKEAEMKYWGTDDRIISTSN